MTTVKIRGGGAAYAGPVLPLPPFEWLAPRSLDEAVRALAAAPDDTMLLGGGTDVLPNLKHGLHTPRRLIGLGKIDELGRIEVGADVRLGAGVTIDRLAREPRVRAWYPALAAAAESIASPQLRRMGTLGGNLCLDTRCGFYNQTAFWRGALGHCLKAEGTVCHVVPAGRRCVAALSADTPAPLIAYQAELELRSVRGTRTLPLADFYAGDGVHHHQRAPDEIVVAVRLPAPAPGLRSSYLKLRTRQAIDFPLLSVAAVVSAVSVRVVVGALGPRPRQVRLADGVAAARPLTPASIDAIASAAAAQCHPLANLGDEPWRAAMVAPTVRRALHALVASVTEA